MDAWCVCQVYLASEEAQVENTGIRVPFLSPLKEEAVRLWGCQACLVQLLRQGGERR